MFLKKINLPIFICSFAVGIFFVYTLGEDMKVIYIYPNQQNYNEIQFSDYTNSCFQYKPIPVKCPTNKNNIKSISSTISK
jgi:hypothetical protein